MTEHLDDRSESNAPRGAEETSVHFPKNRIVGLVQSREELESAVDAPTSGGFLRSEIEIVHGAAAAEKLRANTGRRGLADLVMRFSEFIGVPNDEVTIKNQYADGLKRGQILITVLAPSEERRETAGRILRDHGATEVKFFGAGTIEWPARAD